MLDQIPLAEILEAAAAGETVRVHCPNPPIAKLIRNELTRLLSSLGCSFRVFTPPNDIVFPSSGGKLIITGTTQENAYWRGFRDHKIFTFGDS